MMVGRCKLVIGLTAAFLFAATAIEALDIHTYFRMAGKDQDRYVGEMVVAAENSLQLIGRFDLSQQVSHAFNTDAPDLEITVGMLALVRYLDARDPRMNIQTAEESMVLAMKSLGITLSAEFMNTAPEFHREFPLKDKEDEPVDFNALLAAYRQDAADRKKAVPARPPVSLAIPEGRRPPTPPPAPPPKPAETKKSDPVPDDDPIGAGGFILPPPGQ